MTEAQILELLLEKQKQLEIANYNLQKEIFLENQQMINVLVNIVEKLEKEILLIKKKGGL